MPHQIPEYPLNCRNAKNQQGIKPQGAEFRIALQKINCCTEYPWIDSTEKIGKQQKDQSENNFPPVALEVRKQFF